MNSREALPHRPRCHDNAHVSPVRISLDSPGVQYYTCKSCGYTWGDPAIDTRALRTSRVAEEPPPGLSSFAR